MASEVDGAGGDAPQGCACAVSRGAGACSSSSRAPLFLAAHVRGPLACLGVWSLCHADSGGYRYA